jgi:hypothetical protein
MLSDSDDREATSRSSGGNVFSTRGTTQKDDDANNIINDTWSVPEQRVSVGRVVVVPPGRGLLGNDH